MNDTGNFFDKHADIYGEFNLPGHADLYILEFINKDQSKTNDFLDLGGGAGAFARLIKNRFPSSNVTIVDPSRELLNRVGDESIVRIQGELPDQLNINNKFSYIHLNSVLHHITGSSINESKNLLKKSIVTINNHLENGGYLIVREVFYDGYLIDSLPRTILFYLLSLLNMLNVKFPTKEFLKGLKVCFYTRGELSSFFIEGGFEIIDQRDFSWDDNSIGNKYKYIYVKKKLILLKNWGDVLFILKKNNINM